MKLPVVLLATMTVAVLASCNKCDTPQPMPQEQQAAEQIAPNPTPNPNPHYCPACGMG